MSSAQIDFRTRICAGLLKDLKAIYLMTLAREGKTRRFWVEEGLLTTEGNRLYVPRWDNLRRDIIKESHDSRWAGHPGVARTSALVSSAYYWPHMEDEIEAFMRMCLVY